MSAPFHCGECFTEIDKVGRCACHANSELAASTGYTATWEKRLDETYRFGLAVGALKAVRHLVDAETGLKIAKMLQEIQPYNHRI